MLSLLALAIQVVPVLSADAHAHTGGDAFEWAGIFEVPESTYLWTAQKVKEGSTMKYADGTMKMAVIPASAATEAMLHSLETEGAHSLSMNCIDVVSGGIITPEEDKCYRLQFKQDWWQSLFTIDATGQTAVAIFTEHMPTEFENTAHYLKDDHGDDIEPVAALPEKTPTPATPADAGEEKNYWGPAIGSAVAVNMVTLAGVVFLVPALSMARESYAVEFECVTSAFAAGAISACAFFLLLFESTHLIAEDHTEEVEQIWRWGTMILAGALFPTVVHVVIELAMTEKVQTPATPDVDKAADVVQTQATPDAEKAGEVDMPKISMPEEATATLPRGSTARLVSSVLFGDFMHNLCDGFFIAAAFKGCGSTFGWTVAGSTIAHEIAQELSDYVVLTGKACGLRPITALGLNFLSGTSVLLGVIIVLAADVGNGDIGLLLALGGGAYLNIAFVECMPKLHSSQVSGPIRAVGVFAFILGATAIGLVLLDHEHCVPPPVAGAPPPKADGHNH